MTTPFEAWAVPPGAGLERRARVPLDGAGVEASRLDLDPASVGRLAERLTDARAVLARRRARDLADTLGRVGSRFLDRDDALRASALALLPPTSGLSAPMAEAVLDGMAADWVPERLSRLVDVELGDSTVLDGLVSRGRRRTMAFGPRLCTQIVAGSVPGVGVSALLRSLLVKGPTLVKPGRGDVVLPVLYLRALRDEDPELADAAAVVYWPGGSERLEGAALREAEVVTAYGSDAAVAAVRARAPATARVVAYHHRTSAGAVGVEALTPDAAAAAARDAALAVATFDQRGCVSPQEIHVEEGGVVGVDEFAKLLADALDALEARLPGGRLEPEEAATVQQVRGAAELVAAAGGGLVRHGGRDATWTVVVERDAGPAQPCAGRVVRVRPLADAADLPERLAAGAAHLQTLGVAGFGDRLDGLAAACGAAGISRVAPFRAVAFPPPWWLHDGRGPLTELVRWVEVEGR